MAEREIKYRGLKNFQIFNGESNSVWIYGFYLKRGTYGDPGPQAHIFVYENGYEGYRVDAETIGEFTGLLDENGQEIYEDDIISFDDGKIGIVEFTRGCFVVNCGKDHVMRSLYEIRDWNIKILGNIFENPELFPEKSNSKNKTDEPKNVRVFKSVAYERSE